MMVTLGRPLSEQGWAAMLVSFIAPRSVRDWLNTTVAMSWPTEQEVSVAGRADGRVLTVLPCDRCGEPPQMFAISKPSRLTTTATPETRSNRRRCLRLASLIMRSSTLGGSEDVVVPASVSITGGRSNLMERY